MATLIPASAARTLLLSGQGLLDDPARHATATSVERLIGALGFVQLDSIHRVERAHHLILGTRLDGYRPELLDRLAFRERALFEHWTHAAAYIPIALFPHWKPRFAARAAEMRKRPWYTRRLGPTPERTLARVLARVTRDGPLRASDFERRRERKSSGWWDWTPEKSALEVLWFTGKLAVAGRDGFEKVYDRIERVLPEAHAAPAPSRDEHVDWACASALERLGAATPAELRDFWRAVTPGEAAAWCRRAVSESRAVAVSLGSARAGKPLAGVALPDWEARVRRAPAPPAELRLLAPFDPIVRDRQRAARLFDFDYVFEAYVPAAKRRFGYYVLPVLERDRFVARLDPRHDRERGVLVVEGLWWEPGVRATRARRTALERALEKLARRIGARSVELSGFASS